MKHIPLTGLVGSNPLGALAAFGLLRVCNEIEELHGARLAWEEEGYDDWVACLHVARDFTIVDIAKALAKRHVKLAPLVLSLGDDIRVKPSTFAGLAREQAKETEMSRRTLVDYLAAFGSELITDKKDKIEDRLVKPTAFHMTSGQQKFLRDARKIAASIQKPPRKSGVDVLDRPRRFYETALTGWKYQHDDDLHHLGFDPAAERMYALRHKEPSSDKKNRCEPAAIWLAIEALPLFPVVAARGRLFTTGFSRNKKATVFRWPIWGPPIGLDMLRSLLGSADLQGGSLTLPRLSQRGVSAVFESDRFEFGKGYAVFRPSHNVPSSLPGKIGR